jgi:glycosyltransferase involved in cell wall biosynthesis
VSQHARAFAVKLRKRKIPRVLLLVDYKGWAFDHSALEIAKRLKGRIECRIEHVQHDPLVVASSYDLVFVFFWGEVFHRGSGFKIDQTVKQVSSHRWEDDPRFGPCCPAEMVKKYLWDAAVVSCTSKRLYELIRPWHPCVHWLPNGINTEIFRRTREREGPMTVGWAGNINDPVKGIHEIVKPACDGMFKLAVAPGGLSHSEMNHFYNQLDVIVVASQHEGEPLTLLEGMAAGCFPVCCDVGIVPEIVRNRDNGVIVSERSPEAFREALVWCEANLDHIRQAGKLNERIIHSERNWSICAKKFEELFAGAIENAKRPRFRNDDVSGDTCLERLREFCGIFHKFGLTQVHGVTLRGRTNSYYSHEGDSVEYEGLPNIGKLPNSLIRELSGDVKLEERIDLIDYLNAEPDEIALHGLYHTDYSAMTRDEQMQEMEAGLNALKKIFPQKRIRYFIPPFNRTNAATYEVANELGLQVLGAEGVHLEEHLHSFTAKAETWHRYHHHRFYPESTFPYWNLSLNGLEHALSRNFAPFHKER